MMTMISSPRHESRPIRSISSPGFLLLAGGLLFLAPACGGKGGQSPERTPAPRPEPPPAVARIQSFEARPGSIRAGDGATLTAVFTDGTGKVDPGGLEIQSGAGLAVHPASDTTYTLTVTPAAGKAETRAVTVKVDQAVPIAVPGAFLVAPYLQLGPAPSTTQLALLWQTLDANAAWSVNVLRNGHWQATAPVAFTAVRVPAEPAHRVYAATLDKLVPGESFTYQVCKDAQVVFQNRGMALKAPGQAQRVAVVGDLVTTSPASVSEFRALGHRMAGMHPDLLVVPGDIVNLEGHASQYRDYFFPNLNADQDSRATGGPLLRSTVMAACLGNNDTDRVFEFRNDLVFTPKPNGLAYYYYFSQPLNGPAFAINHDPADSHKMMTPVLSPPSLFGEFLAAAQNRFPRMGNFSFDAGDVHWTLLDSNLYSQWAYDHPVKKGQPWQPRTPEADALVNDLKAWLDRDLAAASGAAWRFVVFHHPAFNVGHEVNWKYRETWMRQIWPILEAHRVSLVFTGHLHSYQRTRPLRFSPKPAGASDKAHFGNLANLVEDTAFTGKEGGATKADGVIHIVTGAGGANPKDYPYPPGHPDYPGQTRPRPYPEHLRWKTTCFTLMDITGDKVDFKQIGTDGAVLDHFILTK